MYFAFNKDFIISILNFSYCIHIHILKILTLFLRAVERDAGYHRIALVDGELGLVALQSDQEGIAISIVRRS